MLLEAYLSLRPSLVRYFAAKTSSVSVAEDIVQDIFVRIAEADGAVEPDDAKAWLFRVGTNILIDRRRRDGRAVVREQSWIEGGERLGGERLAPDASAEAVVSGRQELRRLLTLVDAMPPRMAEAFRLHKLQGLSQTQTANRMGISVKAVEKHLATALQRLVAHRHGRPR